MKLSEVLLKKEYRSIISRIFRIGLVKEAYCLPDKEVEAIAYITANYSTNLESALTKLIFENTKIFLFIDEYIGVFDNRFIVYYDPSIVGFTFIGDSISNWTINKFGAEAVHSLKFQEYCLDTYGVPISEAYIPVNFKAIIGNLDFDKNLISTLEEEEAIYSNSLNHSCDYLSNTSIDDLNSDMQAFMDEYRKNRDLN